jgi:hypothetical protein
VTVDGGSEIRRFVDATTLEDAATLAFAAAAPHAVVDALVERELETRRDHRAVLADLAGAVDADAVAREEGGRWVQTAVAVGHPGGHRIGVVRERAIPPVDRGLMRANGELGHDDPSCGG